MVSKFVARGADGYEAFMGRWSRRLAPLFLEFSGSAPHERVLDVGCGTGSLTLALAARADVLAMRQLTTRRLSLRRSVKGRAIHGLPRNGGCLCVAFSRCNVRPRIVHAGPAFRLRCAIAALEMRRVVRPGGVVAATVWDTFRRECPVNACSGTRSRHWNRRPWTDAPCPAFVLPRSRHDPRAIFERAGFDKVTEALLTIRMEFENFDDYWIPLMTGQGTLAEYMATLPEQVSQSIENSVRSAYLCNRPDGPRSFASVAWAVRGIVPH